MPPFWKKRIKPKPTDVAGGPYHAIPDNESIRYMVLEAGKDDEPLVCNLHVSRLRSLPYFEAISYVWGSDDRNHEVLCNSEVVKITANLHEVLRRVRLATASRTLWADSICINQADGVEKGDQVRLMGAIFSTADRVLICVGGDEDGDAERAASLLSELNDMILEGFTFAGESWNAFPWLEPTAKERLLLDGRWKSLMALGQHPWFERSWVVQEAGLSNNAVILWGKVEISWSSLMRTWNWLMRRVPESSVIKYALPRGWPIHLRLYNERNPRESMALYPDQRRIEGGILRILHNARWLQLKLDSDRVYGFLALAKDASLFHRIRPDYALPALDVYADFARRYLRMKQDLSILQFVQHTKTTIAETNVPSWIPRWNLNLFYALMNELGSSPVDRSSSITWPKAGFLTGKGDILNVRGIIFDYVLFTSNVFSRATTMDEIGKVWRSISRLETMAVYPRRYRESTFLQTLCLSRKVGDIPRWKQTVFAYTRFLKMDGTLSEQEKHETGFLHDSMMKWAHNRRFIFTKRGYYGLTPLVAQKGDICCIIMGAKASFVLRRTEKNDYYRLLGDLYMPGNKFGYNSFSATHEEDDVQAYHLGEDGCTDWVEYGLKEQNISLC